MTRGFDYKKEYFYRHLGSLDEKVKHIERSANHMPTPVYDEVWRGILTILAPPSVNVNFEKNLAIYDSRDIDGEIHRQRR